MANGTSLCTQALRPFIYTGRLKLPKSRGCLGWPLEPIEVQEASCQELWLLQGSTDTLHPPQEPALIWFLFTLLWTNGFICGESFSKWDLFTCLFEMISLMSTGVWNPLWYINEMIKATGLPCSGSWTGTWEHTAASTVRLNFSTHCVLISWQLPTGFCLWVCIKMESFLSENTAACSQTSD